MPERELLMEIASRVENAALVGLAADRIGRFFGMSERTANAWQLIVVEAVNNVIEHSFSYETQHRVRVRLRLADEHMVCEIRDRGKPIPKQVLCKLKSDVSGLPAAEDLAESGYGLQLIATLADRFDYQSQAGTNTLRIEIRIAARDESTR